ncbi:MAG: haloacid dehalogenase [Desulfurococcales archaeon]|nr:haloacid dehalogenase [Desulfurococcales archaeon]
MDYRRRVAEEVERAREFLSVRDEVREKAIKASRDVIKYSGWAITEIQKGDLARAEEYIRMLEEAASGFLALVKPFPELYYSGMAYNALSEYVEAIVLYRIVTGQDIPGYEDLGIPPTPYLQGLGDVVGELRRLVLEDIRRRIYDRAWRYYEIMEAIYLALRSLDLPEALAPGVRHKADVARRLTDDTKAFLIDLSTREKLTRLLERSLGEA